MKIWSLVSQKGGSGKSTLSVQLAVLASQLGEVPVVVDLDPQGSAEVWHGIRGKAHAPGAIAAIPDNLAKVVEGARTMGITLLIIDTPPHTDKTAVEVVRVSDLIICPTQSSVFDVWALRDTVAILEMCAVKNKAIAVINSLPVSGTQEAYDEAAAAIDQMELRCAKQGICHRKPFVSSINSGRGVTEMYPSDKASVELRALYAELTGVDAVETPKKTKAKAGVIRR